MSKLKLIYTTLSFLLFVPVLFFVFMSSNKKNVNENDKELMENPRARAQQEWLMLRDPKTGRIPDNIFVLEQKFAQTLPKRNEFSFYKGSQAQNIQALSWNERGPRNIGGRTRALGIDTRSTANNVTLIAGGISGGLWKSTNDGASWQKKTEVGQLQSVTCLAQDTRNGKNDIWYAGSGEASGNSTSGGGGAVSNYYGDGLVKSTDNGETWVSVASTQTQGGSTQFLKDWQFVWNVAIDPASSGNDVVYAATVGSIHRSADGGNTWTRVLGTSASNTLFYTDVQVTSNGIVYAGGSSNSNMPGIHRSANGSNFAQISTGVSGFPTRFNRVVVATAPSNQNVVYFLMAGCNGTDGTNQIKGHQLWKYTYLSGDGTGAGGNWENRGGNLPQENQGNYGPFNEPFDSQDSYDLLCKVKPDDESYIFIGGTSLYRSADAFLALNPANTNYRIGGYQPQEQNGNYANQHADQHSLVFLPGNSVVAYSGNDGGISKTNDINAAVTGNNPVTWSSLNNGYNVTQFYSVSLASESGSNFIIGGFQDNACAFSDVAGLASWTKNNSGDGGFVTALPLAADKLLSTSQNGDIDAYIRSTNAWAGGIKPAGSKHQQFINPHALDPVSKNTLYYGAGNSTITTGIWVNTNVANADTLTGWSYIQGTDFGSTDAMVSAIGVSNSNSQNVVYYGTDMGNLARIDAASSNSPTITNLTANLPATGGYVSSIAVDPNNSQKALVTFSNYNFTSLCYTIDGGASAFQDVRGNLANINAPSIRWATIFYINEQPHYFLGTSTGIYFTLQLDGANTVWTQEGTSSIGNVVVTMLDFRSADNTLAVATHGRGAFTTQILTPLSVELGSFAAILTLNGIDLHWSALTSANSAGFDIERRHSPTGIWEKIASVASKGNYGQETEYSFSDGNIQKGMVYYRIKQIDKSGKSTYSSTVSVNSGSIISDFAVSQNYPNPFNPSTKIFYSIPREARVSVKIFSSTGELVTTLENSIQSPGARELIFDASRIASGIYFYSVEATPLDGSKTYREVKKMILMK